MVSAVTSLDAQMFAVLRYAKASKRMPGVLFPVWCAKLGSIPPSRSVRLAFCKIAFACWVLVGKLGEIDIRELWSK